MKKTALIIGLIFVNLTCYAQKKRLNSDYTELIEWNGEGKNNSKAFALEIEKESFEKFLHRRNVDTTLSKKFTAEELMQTVKNNEDIFYYCPVEFHKNRVIERGKYIFLDQFSTGIERHFALSYTCLPRSKKCQNS